MGKQESIFQPEHRVCVVEWGVACCSFPQSCSLCPDRPVVSTGGQFVEQGAGRVQSVIMLCGIKQTIP